MMKGRWLVVLLGVPLAVLAFRLGGWWLGLPLAALVGYGAIEMSRLACPAGSGSGIAVVSVAVGAALMPVVATLEPTFTGFAPLALGVIVGVTALAVIGAVARYGTENGQGVALRGSAVTAFGAVYVGVSGAFAVLLTGLPVDLGWAGGGGPGGASTPVAFFDRVGWAGFAAVALPLSVTWVGDSAAFLVGTRWGRAKLAPRISPAKTWTGAWGGIAGSVMAAAAWVWLVPPLLPGAELPTWAVLVAGAVIGACAQFGDLAESLFKREAGVKDSGSFFRGHGGVLDRIDSLLLSLPVGYIVLVSLESLQ